MYCKVEDCIYNVIGTCGIDTEIDENGKCVWMGCNDEPQTEYKKWEMPNTDTPTENTTCVGIAMALLDDEPQTECIYDCLRDYEYDLALDQLEGSEL